MVLFHQPYLEDKMDTYTELAKRNLKTFGSPARREARLARFLAYERKQRLEVRKATWRRRRMRDRKIRNLQLWGVEDYIDYGAPEEEEEEEVEIAVAEQKPEFGVNWDMVFISLLWIGVIAVQNGFTFITSYLGIQNVLHSPHNISRW